MPKCSDLTGALLLAAGLLAAQPPVIPLAPDTRLSADPASTVCVFLPQQMFASDEFEPCLRQLSRAGLYARVAAHETTAADGMNRVMVRPDIRLRDVRTEDFAALILIGGSGASLYWDDSLLHAKCREFHRAGRIVAGIGIAPIAMARAGIMKNRRATVFRDRSAVGYMRDAGARVNLRGLVQDGNLLTAAGTEQAAELGRAVARALRRLKKP
jgi:protease I